MTNRKPPGIETYRPGSEAGGPGEPYAGPRPAPAPRGRRPAPRRQPQRQRSGGFGSVLIFAAVGFLVLIGAGLAFLVIAPPTDLIRDQLVAQVKQTTGRDLTITGRPSLTFYPGLGFSMSGVALSPPPGMGGPAFVKMKTLSAQVKLLPLLSRTVSVDHFILEEPVFELRVDKDGRRSWDFAAAEPLDNEPIRYAQAGNRTVNDAGPQGGSVDMAALDQLQLGDVRIINGRVRYSDATAEARENVDQINVTLALTALGSPLKALGDLRYRKEKVEFEAVLTSLKQIMGKRPANLDATVKSGVIEAAYKGVLDVSGDLRLDGDVKVETGSMRGLAGWLGTRLPPARGFGPFKLTGKLKADGPVYRLAQANLAIDGATGAGNITADTSGARPKISGDLNLSELDLNKYLPPEGGEGRPARPRGANKKTPGNPANAGAGAPGSIEDLIGEPGPRVRGFTKRSGWSTDAIDFSALGLVDADLDLSLGALLYEKIKVGRSRLKVALADRALNAKLDEMQLYEGQGRGVFTLNARPAKPQFGANFNLNGVSAQPLLRDAAEIDWLAGNGRLLLAVTSTGESQDEMIGSLNGTANFAFNNGAIVGVNVPKIVRSVQQGRFTDLKGAPDEQTDFSKFTGSFNIQNGIARNNDLEMQSPLLRVSGEGQVMLPAREIDYTVKPKIVASLSGQGGNQALSGLEIPVRVHGPFESLKYTPDLNSVLKDPGQATNAIRQLGRQYGGEKAGKALDNLLGGGNGDGGGGGNAKKLLDGFLGGR